MMMHSNNSFDPNMASSVTLACCQSLCDVLTELPLPSPVVDKTTHTRTLIAGGLNANSRPAILNDLSFVPHLQQALFVAKQQLNEISFVNNSSPSPYCHTPNIVSPSTTNSETTNNNNQQPPSQLLLALSSQDFFCNSHSPSTLYHQQQQPQPPPPTPQQQQPQQPQQQQQQPPPQPHSISNNNNNAANICSNSLDDLNADLQTIEPSIDKHMTDFHQNLMNDLINDDCDMSFSINNNSNSNDLSSLNHNHHHHHHHHPKHHPSSSSSSSTSSHPSQQHHPQHTTHNSVITQQINSAVSNSNSHINSINNNISNNNDVSMSVRNHKPVKSEPTSVKDEDEDWQLPLTKKAKSESSTRRQSTTPAAAPPPPPPPRRSFADVKPQTIRSVKYSFSDFDYSDSMLLNSSVDIVVRFEQIIDEILSTSCNDANNYEDDDSTDNDDYYGEPKRKSKKKKNAKSSLSVSNHMNGMSFDVSIDADQLKEIMILSAKLKQTNRVVEIERKKIILFLTVLSNQMNIWFTRYKSKAPTHTSEEDEDAYEDTEEREHYWELCCNAAQSALHVMTSSSPNNDKASLISLEELIEVIVDFLSNNLSSTTHVSISASSSNSRSPKTKHKNVHFGVSKRHVTRWTQLLQLLFEFINLRTKGSLTDTLILSLTRISMSALFLLQNTAEMQFVSIEILCHVFEEYQRHRMLILEELLNSLSKIPTKKSHRKDSVLTQMLIRLTNAFFQPNIDTGATDAPVKGSNNSARNTLQHTRESLIKQSTDALQIITCFLSHFLRKCHQSTSNSDVDFKLIFEALLNDLLESMHSPHSTSSIMIVQIIVKLLISFLSPNQQKSQVSSLAARNLAIEYLSIICSKFAQLMAEKEDTEKELEKTLSAIEEVEKPAPATTTTTKRGKKGKNKDKEKEKDKEDDKESCNDSKSPQVIVSKVWNLLVDYFNSEKLYREKLVLASIWIKEKFFQDNEQLTNQFLQKLNTSKPENDDNSSVVDISTAALCIQYMEFVQLCNTNNKLFDFSISHVTQSLSNTTNTTQRSRAMKCLSNILSSSSIERASQLLSRSDLQSAMNSALHDPSTSVREATVDLIGRFVLQSKDQTLCQRYCDLIGERILDTGISVRKRVIKILRDFCIEFPEFEKSGEIAARIVRRINDDGEGIRRLVVDTCRDLWFSHTNSSPIKFKVYSLLHVIATMLNDNSNIESMQSLFDQLIKSDTMSIAQQICDFIMGDILIDEMPQSKKMTQLSAIQCVAMMSQCCPQLMVKHCDTLQSFLSLPCETLIEITLRMKVIQTIERVLPHVNNPSPQLLARIEEDLTKNILQSTAHILQCSVKCLSILIKNHTKNNKLAVELFTKFQQILYHHRNQLYDGQVKEEQVKPKLLRSIYTCGLFAKYFSNDIAEYKDRVRDTFIQLIQSPYSVDIKCKSIVALGFVIESDPKICLLPNVVEIYTRILRNQFSNDENGEINRKNDEMYCIQVLNNFRNYLSESIESDENAVKTIEWSRESLKSMQSEQDDSCSAQSQIIQKYLSSILINALNPNLAIRRVACNVIHVIHSGGHVHPLQLVSHLVAMTSDDDPQIRMRAEHVLHEIERKYHGFVGMKAREAVNLSAIFCKRLQCPGYRVYIEKTSTTSTDGQNAVTSQTSRKEICARLSTLYQVICTNRQSRRAFVTSLLRHLDTTEMSIMKEPSAEFVASSGSAEMIELEFVVENILFFPYTVYDEIMYILNQLECTSSINATHITQLFKEIFIIEKPTSEQQQQQQQQQQSHCPPQYQQNNALFPENAIEDLEDIDLDNEEHLKKYENNIHVNFDLLLSDTRNERLNNLVRSLRTIYLSTLLRTLLKEFYLLKEDKINDYSTNDTKTWEKPVHRRQIEASRLKELFSYAQPQLSFPESLLLSDDLSSIEKQLLDEWKRFKYVSLNNCDPNFPSCNI